MLLGNFARSSSSTRYPLRPNSIASGEPAHRAPTIIASYILTVSSLFAFGHEDAKPILGKHPRQSSAAQCVARRDYVVVNIGHSHFSLAKSHTKLAHFKLSTSCGDPCSRIAVGAAETHFDEDRII